MVVVVFYLQKSDFNYCFQPEVEISVIINAGFSSAKTLSGSKS